MLHRRHWLLPLLLALLQSCSPLLPTEPLPATTATTPTCPLAAFHLRISISYPFYLHDATAVLLGSKSSYYCDYPGLAVQCKDGKQTVLQLGGDNYTVSGIDYQNFTVSLVDQEVFEDRSCPRVDHDVTFPDSSCLSFPDNTVDFLVFFLNYNINMEWFPPKTISLITCSTYEGPRPSFVSLPQGDVPYEDWQKACKKIKLHVLNDVLENWNWSDPQNRTAWSSGAYGDALHTGFQLVWDWRRKNSSCNQCEGSSGHCGYNQAGEFVGCLCSHRRMSAQNICSSGRHFSGSSYCGYPGLRILLLNDGNYTFSNIHYIDKIVSLVDQEVSEDESCCPRVDRNVTFPDSSWLTYSIH